MKSNDLLLVGGGLVALYLITRKSGTGPSWLEQIGGGIGSAVGSGIPQFFFSSVGSGAQAFYNTSWNAGAAAGATLNQTLQTKYSPSVYSVDNSQLPAVQNQQIANQQFRVNPFGAVYNSIFAGAPMPQINLSFKLW